MKIVVLGSSSSGNSTFVEFGDTKFLIDVGLGFNDIKNKLYQIGEYADDIDFIIITHAHNDHVKSLHSFSRVYKTKIYIGKETFDEYPKKDLITNYEFLDEFNKIGDIKFSKIPISHDKKGYGFIFEKDGVSLFYMTDTGMIHSRYHEKLKNKTFYMLESNHDVEMEMNGKKDELIKIRNIGDAGHLSNEECAMYLSRFVGDDTKGIMLMHLSEDDNTSELAYNVNRENIRKDIPIYLSHKYEISEIIQL